MYSRSGASTALFSAALVAVAFTSFMPQVPAGQMQPDAKSLGADEIVTGDGAIVNLKKMSESSMVHVGCGVGVPMQSYIRRGDLQVNPSVPRPVVWQSATVRGSVVPRTRVQPPPTITRTVPKGLILRPRLIHPVTVQPL